MSEDWITPSEAAQLLQVTADHVRYLLRCQLLEGKKFGHAWMVSRQSVEAYAQTTRKPGPKPKEDA